MFYYLPWTLLVVASLCAALIAFLWALNGGQFSDQDRARYLPLRDEAFRSAGASGRPREVYALIGVLGGGVIMIIFVLITVLAHRGS